MRLVSLTLVILVTLVACGFPRPNDVEFDAGVDGVGDPQPDANQLPISDWVTRHGGPGDDSGDAVAVSPNGDIIMVGTFMNTITLGGPPISSAGSKDVWVARYSADGSYRWSVRLGGLDVDYGTGVAVDGNGDVYVVGSFIGPVNFGGGSHATQGGGFLVKLAAASGAYRWDHAFGVQGDYAATVAVLDANSVVIGGQFSGTADFGGGNLTATGGGDSFVAAYNMATGAHVWSKALNTSGGFPAASEIAHVVAVGGDVIVTASFAGTATLGGKMLTARGTADILIVRFHGTDGTYIWSRSLQQGSSQNQVLSSSSIATDGNHIFLGGFLGGTVNLGGGDMTATGRFDAFVASYNSSDGTYVWHQRFGGGSCNRRFFARCESDETCGKHQLFKRSHHHRYADVRSRQHRRGSCETQSFHGRSQSGDTVRKSCE